MKIIQCEQRTSEWYAARQACLTTASDIGAWITKNDQRSKDARMKRICEHLAAMVPKDAWQLQQEEKEEKAMQYNIPVQRGNALEERARACYSELSGHHVSEIGFITTDDGLFGCSPDGLCHREGWVSDSVDWSHGTELKCPWPSTHVDYLLTGTLPDEYVHQVHASMAISGLRRWDFLSFCPGFPPMKIVVEWGSVTDEILGGMDRFRAEYRAMKARLAEIAERHGKEAA